MSDMNDPKSGALEPIRTEALDTVRPPAQQLRWNARATHRAMQGWQRVQSHEDWERINEESGEQYESGAFLLERLGADRFLDPRLMATILALRQRLIAESGITTAAETMLVDQAVLSYYHTLRVQGWIGDLAVRIEHEFFGDDAFTEMARKGHRRADRFAVEDRVRQLSERLMPLSDRANRMMIRNLKTIKELRQGQVPAIAIGRADQVTVTNRPSRRLRPVKTELPQALSDRAVRIAERSSDTIETRPNGRGYLRAIDPLTSQSRWRVPFKSPNFSGTLVTAGGLVFTGRLTGEFMAVDADTGKILWEFQTSTGIVGQPITWELDVKQYVTVTSGATGPM
jgi:hypothetical protein